MNQAVRYALAGLGGLVAAFVLILVIEAVGSMLYPPPAGLNLSDPEQARAYMDSLPFGVFLYVLIGWVAGTFGGGAVACAIAKTRPYLFAGIVGGLVLAASVANMLMIEHPPLFWVAALVAVPASAYLAGRWAKGWGSRSSLRPASA